jgi:alpha-glucosidase
MTDQPSTRVRVQYLTPNALRVTHARADSADFPPDRPWLAHVLLPTPPLALEQSQLVVDTPNGLVHIRDRAGNVVLAEARVPRLGFVKQLHSISVDIPAVEIRSDFGRVEEAIGLTLKIETGESFYGWGEWFNAFRRAAGEVKLKIRDAIALIQHRETYSGIPVFLSSRGYAFWLINSHESEWRINKTTRELEIEAAGPNADYIVIYGPAFRDIIATYTQLTGRPPLIPRWAFGLMVTGYPQEHQSIIEERAREHRKRHVPLDAIILDYHWEERYHNFQWRHSLIPNPPALISNLKSLGVRLGLILTPFINNRNRSGQRWLLNTLASNLPRGTEQDDERDLEGYAEGKAKGYFAHDAAKWWFGAGGMLDFTNPEAAAWWNARMKPLYEQGIAFFKNDDGEYLPLNARSSIGLNGREYHNLYGFFYSRAIYDGMAALDDRRPFIYARSVWAGAQRYPAIFLGDQHPTFEYLHSAMRAGLNLGLLGFAYWTADVFGLDGQTTPETHMRYSQWALMIPVARYFWRPPATDDTRFPWSHNGQVEANFRAITELRYRLLPYYCALAWEAYLTGLPILRPMLLEFQADARFADAHDQQMLGVNLLLAPVVEQGATKRKIILPAGVWHDFWSTQTYAGGGEIDYPAPLDRLPLLVRGGSILPLGPVWQHISDDHRFEQLQLHIYPPYPASGVLYDDDGHTRAYQRGEYSVTRFTAEGDSNQVTVHIPAAEGNFPAQTESRTIEVILHRTASEPSQVRVNGTAIKDWRIEIAQATLRISITAPTATATTLHIQFA